MKKFIIGAMLAIGLVACANPTHANAKSNVKVMTMDEAATKIARLQKKAAFSKKNVKCTIRLKSSKKAFVGKKIEELDYLVAKKQWGVLATLWNRTTYRWCWDEPAYTICFHSNRVSSKSKFKSIGFSERGVKGLETFKNNIATVTFIFKGSHRAAKGSYNSYNYEMKIYNYLTEKTRGYSQAQKAAYTLDFISHRMGWSGDYRESEYGPKAIWTGKAIGACQHQSNVVEKYLIMAGVKHVAQLYVPELNHMDNVVRFQDGRIYLCGLASCMGEENMYEDGISEEEAWEYLENIDDGFRSGGEKIIIEWEDGKTETYKSSLSKKSYYSKFSW